MKQVNIQPFLRKTVSTNIHKAESFHPRNSLRLLYPQNVLDPPGAQSPAGLCLPEDGLVPPNAAVLQCLLGYRGGDFEQIAPIIDTAKIDKLTPLV